ncbi:unnamed protein product [Ostreobium quekettii]|uniref:EGF-like domain-containing protein n=1 Tax=Ostreobium quekettii TaxID=121088 RepID=A0A8S1J6W6_9CHLO|nr:unnamed protein product [Ostreobium quekettii]|eukprot:evm.model.scf_454.1 EVM.evm.TU.scf_454.1   scf_454:23068-24633(+)
METRAAVFATTLLALAALCAADCSLELGVDPGASRFTLGGAASASLVGSLGPLEGIFAQEQRVGVSGALRLESDEDCPQGADGLDAFWRTLSVRSRQGAPLAVYPGLVSTRLTGLGFTLSTFNFTDVGLSWSASAFRADAGGAPGAFVAEVVLAYVAGGLVYETASASGVLNDVPLNYTVTQEVSGLLTAEASTLTLDFLPKNFTFGTDIRLDVRGFGGFNNTDLVRVEGDLNVTLAGTVSASVTTGCAPSCGANGRCMRDQFGRLGCQCQCGWEGASCDVPSGFCSPFPPSEIPVCGSDDRVVVEAQCACREGWRGPLCDICAEDGACAERLGAPGAKCVTGFGYGETSAGKVYACEGVSGENVLAEFFGPRLGLRCNTSGSGENGSIFGRILPGTDDDEDGEGTPFCVVDFLFDGEEEDRVACEARGCTFQVGSEAVACAGPVACTCDGRECKKNINDTIGTVRSMALDCGGQAECEQCGEGQQACTVTFDGALGQIDLVGACAAGECRDPEGDSILGN